MADLKLGKYRHYKGSVHEVFGLARHSETLEELVMYKDCRDDSTWVRPKDMFLETVEVDGKTVPRFGYIDE